MPATISGSPEFGAHRVVLLSQQQEKGIGFVVGEKGARLDQRVDQVGSDAALSHQVALDARELAGVWQRKVERKRCHG